MNRFFKQPAMSPLVARVAPFAVFLALTFCQGKFGEASRFWFYLVKTMVGAWLVWRMRPHVAEMKWKFSGEALVAGVAVFAVWVGLEGRYPTLDGLLSRAGLARAKSDVELAAEFWNPHARFGQDSALAWMFLAVRVLGSSLVVPPLEEVFFRSFVYRYLFQTDFLSVPLERFAGRPFLLTSIIFGLEHNQWLAGILCGLAYQGLVCRKKRLGDAITAHAITNLLLGLWVVRRGAWNFW